jgi:hypothetical protein
MRITFRKNPQYNGLARLAHSMAASLDGKEIATLQQDERNGTWFWYGMDNNTLWNKGSFKTLEECKEDCRRYVKETWLPTHSPQPSA